MEKCYLASCNDELLFDDLEECVQFVVDQSEYPLTKTISVFEKYQPLHRDLLDIECVIENMQCRAEDIGGEYAEEYTNNIWYDEKKKDALFNLVLNWMNKNLDQPTFYTTGKLLEEIEVTEDLCKSLNIDLD